MNQGIARAVVGIAIWGLLSGCFLFGPNDDPNAIPEPEYEGCSDDHDTFWAPADAGAEIVVDTGLANQPCNRLQFHSAGGGQGGDVFHIEPRLRITEALAPGFADLTWEVSNMDGEVLNAQGFEIYDGDLAAVSGGFEYRAQVFISSADRGKNLRLRAITNIPDAAGSSSSTEVVAAAAVYLAGPE